MASIWTLGPGDEAALDGFLARHAESSMFLRSNLRLAGLLDRGETYQGTYVAAEDGGAIVAVVAHMWRGNLLLQAPVHLPALVREAVARSGRAVRGLLGPWGQVEAARRALGVDDAAVQYASREDLFALSLDALVVPPDLTSGRVVCRRPHDDEIGLLVEWRVAYVMETFGAADGPALRASSREEVEHWHAEHVHWVLLDAGVPVAYSTFNAHLPDMVQVGGVWTPPALRGRGYARCVVAGSLLEARAGGVSGAVLFTDAENKPARRAYQVLGFRVVGDYALVFLTR